ncbi:hypothetical protein LOCC1_G001613 [Lachnellula occidentalis]|uniref:Uncharacterized protein n=1 Tax=Lachnellula occidentalis TaxID=215460 RepID=A0A8H8S6V7_9HELO|nr:hypothetical protein LOCC1_G001613 [Lachnellula occidentalis]
MAWGRSAPKPPPPTSSALSKILPLLVLLIVLGGCAFVGYHIYLSVQDISSAASDKMQSKNMVFTKDGLRVGVKERKTESYVDSTQSLLVKAWNLSTWPGYKSRLWNQQQVESAKPESRKPLLDRYSRHASSAK